jgi:hypothetical protein
MIPCNTETSVRTLAAFTMSSCIREQCRRVLSGRLHIEVASPPFHRRNGFSRDMGRIVSHAERKKGSTRASVMSASAYTLLLGAQACSDPARRRCRRTKLQRSSKIRQPFARGDQPSPALRRLRSRCVTILLSECTRDDTVLISPSCEQSLLRAGPKIPAPVFCLHLMHHDANGGDKGAHAVDRSS